MATESTRAAAKEQTAPAAEQPDKPDTPIDLKKPSWKYGLKSTVREFGTDQCTDLAAGLTYHMVLAIFPALLAMVSIVGLFGQAEAVTTTMLDMIRQVAPGGAADSLEGPIQQLAQSNAAGITFVIGLAGSLWSASGYVKAFGRSMNHIYEVDEGRPFWKLLPSQLLVTLIVLLLAAAMMIMLVVSGPVAQAVGDVVGLGGTAVTVWSIAKWPVMVIFAIVIIAVLYHGTANVKQPKFHWVSIGALIALVVLALATVGFAFYVANFSNYNATYGAIGGVIVLLLWFWITNISLLFGAEFDAEVERVRELQAGIKAEETIQLPPRDTRQSEKQAEKEEEAIAEGKRLRKNH